MLLAPNQSIDYNKDNLKDRTSCKLLSPSDKLVANYHKNIRVMTHELDTIIKNSRIYVARKTEK